jgi:hypothetical protein
MTRSGLSGSQSSTDGFNVLSAAIIFERAADHRRHNG